MEFLALAALSSVSLLVLIWQLFAAWRFPLHRKLDFQVTPVGVTVLKPLKDADPNLIHCLRTWIQQEYSAPYQVLFGVRSESDEASRMVRQLIRENPKLDLKLVICPETFGSNGKVSTLIQLYLQARHPILIVSDADVQAPPEVVSDLAAHLQKTEVGMVTCLYSLARPSTPAMHWEYAAINVDFWSQVLQARMMQPMDFALGAVMALRRSTLEAIGRFHAIAGYLADDFVLGNRVFKHHQQVDLSGIVVECLSPPMGWRQAWDHQLRWARTIRFCKPVPYAMSVLSNPTLWPLLWVAFAPSPITAAMAGSSFLLRILSSYWLARKLASRPAPFLLGGVVLLKDLLQLPLWLMAFAGSQVTWRGARYRILPGGKLIELKE